MRRRWGLQATMTATYVAVTAGIVLLTELVIFGVAALSPPTPLTRQAVQGLAQATADGVANKVAKAAFGLGPPRAAGLAGDLITGSGTVSPGQARPDGGGGVVIPQLTSAACDLAPASFAVVVSRDGTVLASSYPACYPAGGRGAEAQAGVPRKVLASFVRWSVRGSGQTPLPGGDVVWATAPVMVSHAAKGQPPGGLSVVAMLYLEVPARAPGIGGVTVSPGLVRTGVVLLAAAFPVGLAFGLLSTRRLTRRLGRLAALSLRVADGDFGLRVPVRGHDEVSRLEENFNRMAGQLQASLDATRQLGEANARHAERTRIARELHDAISQELFSLSVLAGGLRRALPAGSAVLPQVEIMERTAGDTMREMRSLLLALRPAVLEEDDLPGALAGVCRSYEERLGIPVGAELDLSGLGPRGLPPAVEHAILRVTQEAVGNAARHAAPGRITVRLEASGGSAVLEVTDDGRGFDVTAPPRDPGGLGLGLHTMRDRVTELGGLLTVDSAPGAGTTIRASFPLGAASLAREGLTAEDVTAEGVAADEVAADEVAAEEVAAEKAAEEVAAEGVTEEAR